MKQNPKEPAAELEKALDSKQFKDSLYNLRCFLTDCGYTPIPEEEKEQSSFPKDKTAFVYAKALLRNAGVPLKLQGFGLLCDLLTLSADLGTYNGTVALFLNVSKSHGKSAQNIERLCRYALGYANSDRTVRKLCHDNVTVGNLAEAFSKYYVNQNESL